MLHSKDFSSSGRSGPLSLLTVVTMLCCLAPIAATEVITIDDPRSVASALTVIEHRTGVPVSYEDPPYMFSRDLQDVTEQFRRGLGQESYGSSRIIVPKGTTLRIDFSEAHSAGGLTTALNMLSRVLNADSQARGMSVFGVVQTSGYIHVVPRWHRDSTGNIVNTKPMLDNEVVPSTLITTGEQALKDICEQLARNTGARVVLGVYPRHLFAKALKVNSKIAATPARTGLERIIANTGVAMSWRLLYDPGLKWYVLNVHEVVQK